MIRWSTFFDNLRFVLVGFLALQAERRRAVAAYEFRPLRQSRPGELAAA